MFTRRADRRHGSDYIARSGRLNSVTLGPHDDAPTAWGHRLIPPPQPAVPQTPSSHAPDTRKYRPSPKRDALRAELREKLKANAWQVFAELGLDGATVAAIVAGSGASNGTFYNYFGTQQAVFTELLGELLGEIRRATREARQREPELVGMMVQSFRAFFELVLQRPGATDFCLRNQHHIRAFLHGFADTNGLLDDLRGDLRRALPGKGLSDAELALLASVIVAIGLEALMLMSRGDPVDLEGLCQGVSTLIAHGAHQWQGCRSNI